MAEPRKKADKTRSRWQARRGLLAAALPGLALTFVLLVLHTLRPSVIAEAGNLIFDFYQRLAPRAYQNVPVKVVDIDDASLARLGQWPWPRTDIARLATTLTRAGAAAVAFDMVFSEPDRTSPARIAALLRKDPAARGNYDDIAALPDHDIILGKALAGAPAVDGYFLSHEKNLVRPIEKAGIAISGTSPLAALPTFEGAIASLPDIDAGTAGAGFVSIVGNRDGIVRTLPLLARIGDTIYPALSLEALRVAQGAGAIIIKTTSGSGELGGAEAGIVEIKTGNFAVPTTRAGELWMYYRLPRPDDTVPAWKILTGALSAQQLKTEFSGRIVVVGTGAAGLRDIVATPVSDRALGAVVHAQAIEQMILGQFLTRPDWSTGLERALLLIFGVGLSFALPGLGALRGGVLAAVALVGTTWGSWFAFRSGALLLDPTYTVLEVISVYVSCTLYSFYREERARNYIHRAFDRYLSPEVVRRITRDPGQLELGGEERDMTVMFCDIRGFSHISENLTPPEVIAFLIDFLTPTSEVLLAHKATIDKFIGDAILAFWNAPLDDPDHATNAALATLALIEKMKELNAVNRGVAGTSWPGEVKIGIGLDSGPCCVGNIGSAKRLSYSLIGDTVNLASRIEGLTKIYGVPIALGDGTASRLEGFATIEIDFVRVVGRDRPERIHALIGPPEMSTRDSFRALRSLQDQFLAAYRAQRWSEAEEALAGMSALAERFDLEKLVAVYDKRVRTYRATLPGPEWDGVYEAAHK